MTETTRRTRGVQQGPRSVQVVENVRVATLAELTRVGFAGFTVDGVARAAGVNRTTIYRRWPTRAALLASAVEPLLERYDADPATGSLGGDLLALMLVIRDAAQTPEGRALAEAVLAGSNELRDLVSAVLARVLAPFTRALDQAAARGDRRDPAEADALVHLIFSGVVLWEQMHGSIPTDDDCRRMLDLVLAVR